MIKDKWLDAKRDIELNRRYKLILNNKTERMNKITVVTKNGIVVGNSALGEEISYRAIKSIERISDN